MDYAAHVVTFISIYVILAIGYNLLLGYSGLFSFAHAAFYGVGAYACALLTVKLGLNFFAAIVLGCLTAAVVGAVIAIPSLRVSSHYLVVFTLGIQVVLYEVFANLVGLTGGEGGLRGIPAPGIFGMEVLTTRSYMLFALIFAALCVAIGLRLVNSPFGRTLKAIRDDEVAAAALGKNVVGLKVLTFVLAAVMAAVAGALYAHYVRFINPYTFSLNETILILTLVIVGGVANMWGSVLGAAVLIALPEAFALLALPAYIVGPGRQIFYGALLVAMMFFRPQGLLKEYRIARPKLADAPSTNRGHPEPPAEARSAVIAKGVVEARVISKSFGGLKAVDDFSLSLDAGGIICLVGPNGAGKTTVFNLVTGFLPVDSGKIYCRGRDITALPPHKRVRYGIVRSFQDLRLFPRMTVLDNVAVAAQNQPGENLFRLFLTPGRANRAEKLNRKKAMSYLEAVGIVNKSNDLAEDLSFPEQKLLCIARLLATGGNVLLLDEPCSSLDPVSMNRVLNFLRDLAKQAKTICIVEHNMEVVRRFGEQVFFMHQGKILASGTAEELMANSELAKVYFGD